MSNLIKNNTKNFGNLLDDFFSNNYWGWQKPELTFPPVNINEDSKNFEVEVFAPGLDKNDFKINLENSTLTISYDKKIENSDKKSHRVEYYQTSFKRSFTIDDSNINFNKIDASYKDGVLRLILPKKEEVEVASKLIEVK